jgi:ribokinase
MNRVVVIGNAGLDLGLVVPRLPLPGETLIGAEAARALGGKGLNQAVVAARCGVPVRFCAPLGNDAPQADEVEHGLSAERFEQLLLPRLGHPTDFSLLMVLPGGENSIVSTSACSLALTFADAEPALREIGSGDVVLLQGNLALDVTGAILAAARRAGATTVFNPAPFWPGTEKLVAHCSLVIANRLEAKALGAALEGVASIVTLGAEGCVYNGRTFPAEETAAVDTTGCGDAFCGVMAAALARGLAIDQAISLAQKAAALTAARPGAFDALPSREELSLAR